MKATFHHLLRSGYLALAILIIGTCLQAQNLENGTTGKISNNGGLIKFKESGAQFRNSNAVVTDALANTGVIEFTNANQSFTDGTGAPAGATALGNSAAWRIPGDVHWTSASAQDVQARYYNILRLSGAGAKNLIDEIYVGRTYTAAGGDRTYAGDFYYDGATTDTTLQIIFPESSSSGTTNRYNNLFMMNSAPKYVASATSVNVINNSTFDATATGGTTIYGTYYSGVNATQASASPIHVVGATSLLSLGSGPSDMAGQVNIGTGGIVKTEGAGLATFSGTVADTNGTLNSAAGDITLAAAGFLKLLGVDGKIDVDASRTLTVTGTFTNAAAVGSRTNMIFDDASNTLYNGIAGQLVVGTDTTHQYGNFAVANAGQKTTENTVRFTGNYSVTDESFLVAPTHNLVVSDPAATITYTTDQVETIGKMKRNMGGLATAMKFNNNETFITLTTGTASVVDMALDMQPGVEPYGNGGGIYRPNADVKRRTIVDWTSTANDWVSTVKLGFLRSEGPANQDSLNTLRFKEVIPGTPATVEKIATGQAVNRDVLAGSDPLLSASIAGIKPLSGTPTLAMVEDTHDIFLRGGPTEFITINHGRWSNPGTWDEGEEPSSIDYALVKHQVHTGFTRTAGDNYITAEKYPLNLASRIIVDNNTNAPDALLVFGQIAGQGTQSPTPNFELTNASPLTNNSGAAVTTLTTTADLNSFVTTAPAAYANRGIIVYQGASLTADDFINNGATSNGGTILIGKP